MASDAYLKALQRNRNPINLTPVYAKEHNISINQHVPLDEILGHSVDEQFVQQYNQDIDKRGWVLPTDRYIGPGNSLNRGTPQSEADRIAQQHDLEYAWEQHEYQIGEETKEEAEKHISESDTRAINKFSHSGTLGSIIGHDGLQIKKGFEKVVGHTYPSFNETTKQSSIAGKMVKTILPAHQAWWNSLSKAHRDRALADPAYNYLFSDSEKNPAIAKQEAAASKEGFKRPGGVAPVFKQAAANAAKKQKLNNPQPSTSAQGTDLENKVDPTKAQPTKTIQPEISAATSSTDVEMGLPGTGQGTGGSGDGNANSSMELYSPERPLSIFGTKMSTYRKVHRFLTFAIAPNWINIDLTTPTEQQRWLTTCLAEIPWDRPVLYLNQSEFDLIPNGSYVKEVRVKIVHRGNRIAFETGEVATRLATLNQIQNIVVSHGVNKTGWGVNRTYTSFTVGNPMKPTAIGAPIYNTLDDEWYGFPNASASFTSVIPSHQLGIEYALDNYFCLANAVENFGGVPPLQECMQYMDGKTTIDQTVGEFTYTPRMGMLKRPLKHLRSGLPVMQSAQILINGTIEPGTVVNPATGTIDATGAIQTNNSSTRNPSNTFAASSDFDMFALIEKSDILRQGQWGQYKQAHVQPSIHVGLQAIPSLTSTNILGPIENWTDGQATWDVICEMDVMEHQPTKLPYATVANVPAGDVIYDTAQGLRSTTNSCTFAGLHTVNPIR
jgi:hypothetical protein